MIIGVLKEDSTERRVAVTPDTIAAILKLGIKKIIVEQGAGTSASYSDQAYSDAGATTPVFRIDYDGTNVTLVSLDGGTNATAAAAAGCG